MSAKASEAVTLLIICFFDPAAPKKLLKQGCLDPSGGMLSPFLFANLNAISRTERSTSSSFHEADVCELSRSPFEAGRQTHKNLSVWEL